MRLLTLIKKDLKSLFCKPVFLGLIALLCAIPIVMLVVSLSTNVAYMVYTGFEHIVAVMVIALAIATPVVSVMSVCREHHKGTYEMLCSMPVSREEILASKIISQTVFFLMPMLIMIPFPIIFDSFGDVNFLQCYLALALLLAFELFVISMSVMIASKMGRALISATIAYLVLALSYLLGILSPAVRFLPFGTGFDSIFGGFLAELSFFVKTESISYELFDWTSLAFFIIGTAIFVFITFARSKRKIASIAISLALVLAVGVIPMLLPYRLRQIDINANKLYTPSADASEYLSSLKDKVTVYLIDPYGGEESLYNAILRTVDEGKSVNLKIVNSSEDKDILERFGLAEVSSDQLAYVMIVEGQNERWRLITPSNYFWYYNNSKDNNLGYLSAEMYYYYYEYCERILNNYSSSYDSLSDNAKETFDKCAKLYQSLKYETFACLNIEKALTEAIAYVTADSVPTAYYVSGHGEDVLPEISYSLKSNASIPSDVDLLIIDTPTEDYSEGEINTLIKYVDNGGKLCLFLGKANYDMPNLSRLLAHYGLSIDSTVITTDEKTVITATLNKKHESFSSLISAGDIELENASRITTVEGGKFTYSTMLYYKHTEGEGEDAKSYEYPVAVSVSENNEKRIALFTGGDAFGENSSLGEEELERASTVRSYVESWMFDEFSANIVNTNPKVYQRPLYLAENTQIAKIAVIFSAIVAMAAASIAVYIITRRVRSKKASKRD